MKSIRAQRILAALAALILLAGCTATPPPAPAPTNKPVTSIPGTTTPPAAPAPVSHPWRVEDPQPGMVSYSRPAPAKRTQYALSAEIDPVAMRVNVKQTVRFTNNESADLASLVFHLFPNAPYFQKEEDGSARIRPGLLAIDDLSVDGQKVPGIQKADGQALEVPLTKPLVPGQAAEITLTWHEIVPSVADRYGVIGPAMYLGNFYPILAVHDKGGWHLDKYIETGDPFYSEVADYDVTFVVPNGWQVAATGHYDTPKVGDVRTTFRFTAQNVRDFAAAASSHWSVHEADVDGIHVRYFRDQADTKTVYSRGIVSPEEAMKLITGSLHFFSQKFSPYPYADFTVVDHIGMEYPQFIMAEATTHVIPHEVAHQWWYGVVGNDELRQIWDEGLTEYAAMLYKASVGIKDQTFGASKTEAMNKTLYAYAQHERTPETTPVNYGQTIYGRGWMLWESLRLQMGTAAFDQMVRDFYSGHKFGIATWDDWRTLIKERAGDKGTAVFDMYVIKDQKPTELPPDFVNK